MAPVLRGEIYWAKLESENRVFGHEQAGRRPVLILSSDDYNHNARLVMAALITSKGARRPHAVPVQSVQMRDPSWVLADQVRTLSVDRLEQPPMGMMSEGEIATVIRAILLIIGS